MTGDNADRMILPLTTDLQSRKHTLDEFFDTTLRVLHHIKNIVTEETSIRDYLIMKSTNAGITKFSRPVNCNLFISEPSVFTEKSGEFKKILNRLRDKLPVQQEAHHLIDSVLYTVQQSIGIGLDFLVNPNSARKHVGNRFEELIRHTISSIGIANKKVVLKIPYDENSKSVYSCETDMVFSPFEEVKSNSSSIHPDEVVVSLKTSSKDRMGKIFIDKLLMERFVEHPVKVVGIFLNDVQRKESDNISSTFVSGLFMVYTRFLTEAEGMYFIDPPSKIESSPYSDHIFRFSKFLTEDIRKLLIHKEQ